MITNTIVIPTKVEKIGQWELPNGSKPVHPRNLIVFYKICGELQETQTRAGYHFNGESPALPDDK